MFILTRTFYTSVNMNLLYFLVFREVRFPITQFPPSTAALSRAVCWYLTCERYWEAGTMEPPEFPWGLVTGLVLLLTLGVSLAYYIVWVLCE